MKNVLAAILFLVGFLPATSSLSKDPPESVLVEEVRREFLRHNYGKVIDLYHDFEAKSPDRYMPLVVKVLYSQAMANTGEIDAAIDTLQEVLADLPPEVDSLRLQHDLANLLFLERRFDDAKSAYQRLLVRGKRTNELLSKARERLTSMKGRDATARRKDYASLEMLDLETALDAGEVPDGADVLLQRIIEQNPRSPQAAEAQRLRIRVKDLRTQKAEALLDEARRLFDEEKKYVEVREILDQIMGYYADVSDKKSVEALQKAVQSKLGTSR